MALKLRKNESAPIVEEEEIIEGDEVVEEEASEEAAELAPSTKKRSSKLKPSVRLQELTANDAAELLTQNTNNRKKKPVWIKTLAERMLDGEWGWNGEPLIFDEYGRMVSGQHRLEGLVFAQEIIDKNKETYGKKKLKFLFTVVEGVSEKMSDTIDAEIMTRKLKDVFYRHREFGQIDKKEEAENEAKAKTLAGAIRLVWIRFNGKVVAGGGRLSHREALSFFEKHPMLKDCVEFVHEENGGKERFISGQLTLPYAAALMYLCAMSNADVTADGEIIEYGTLMEKAEEFVTLMASGAELSKTHPAYSLRHHLKKLNDNPPADKRDQVCHHWIKAWNLFAADQEGAIKDVTVKKNEVPRAGGFDREYVPPIEEITAE